MTLPISSTCAPVRLSEWMMLGCSALPSASTGMQPFMEPLRPTQAMRWGLTCCNSSRMPSYTASRMRSGSCSDQFGRGYSVG